MAVICEGCPVQRTCPREKVSPLAVIQILGDHREVVGTCTPSRGWQGTTDANILSSTSNADLRA